jgi:hypothetical protein
VDLIGNEAVASQGVFNFTGFTVVTEPGSDLILELVVRMNSLTSEIEFEVVNHLIKI